MEKNRTLLALVVPYPGQGHINPMLQFSKRLVSKGIKVSFANTIYTSKSMHVDDKSPNISFVTYSDGFDEGGYAQAESPASYISTLRNVGSQTLQDLIKKLDECGNPVDVLIYDSVIVWALDVANKFGLVKAVFFTQLCAVNYIYYCVYKGLVSLPKPDESHVVSVPGLPVFEPWETPAPLGFFDVVIDQFSNVDRADWVLFSTFQELEEEVLGNMTKLWKVRTIGPTLPSMYLEKRLEDDNDYGINLFKPDDELCMNWLKDKPSGSVIYISFGSLANVEAEQMEEVAWGLKETNFNFLWVVKKSEEPKLPNNLISEKGLVVTWSPQLEILAHESIGCFVTHCGFNSVLEAISLGVPIIGVPQWSDQPTNAKYVEDVWGVGVRARPDDKGIVRRHVIESCIREVMEGEKGKTIKENVTKWKNLALEAVDVGGSSDKNIDDFVAELLLC